MSSSAIFHGNERESLDLAQIVARNCTCGSTNSNGHPRPRHAFVRSACDRWPGVRPSHVRSLRAERNPVGRPTRIPSMTRTRGRCTC